MCFTRSLNYTLHGVLFSVEGNVCEFNGTWTVNFLPFFLLSLSLSLSHIALSLSLFMM